MLNKHVQAFAGTERVMPSRRLVDPGHDRPWRMLTERDSAGRCAKRHETRSAQLRLLAKLASLLCGRQPQRVKQLANLWRLALHVL